jgi:putative transposase
MNYHRYYDAGEIIFITQVVKDRKYIFHNPFTLGLLQTTFENVKTIHPFTMLAYVILPDHFHVLLEPTGQSNFSQIMHSLKSNFTKAYKQELNIQNSLTFWQRRFWDHIIRDENDLENHIHYIHFNPVKHGYVEDPAEWKASSFNIWLARGAYSSGISWDEPKHQSWGE